ELATHPAGTAAGVEDPRAPRHHRVDQPRLAVQVLTRGRHRPEPLHVPVRVLRVLLDTTRPQALLDHAANSDVLDGGTSGSRSRPWAPVLRQDGGHRAGGARRPPTPPRRPRRPGPPSLPPCSQPSTPTAAG